MEYYLMNKNRKVLRFTISHDGYYIKNVLDNVTPLGVGYIGEWLHKRVTGGGRVYKFKIIDTEKVIEILEKTHAVSVNDTFWVRKVSEILSWDDVSPYRSRVYDFSTSDLTDNPSLALIGSHVQFCRFRDGLEIYKANDFSARTEGVDLGGENNEYTLPELYCSQIAEMMSMSTAHYMSHYFNDKMYTVSSCLSNELKGLTTLAVVSRRKSVNYKELLRTSTEEDRRKLLDMMLIDYLTCNTGRDATNIHYFVCNDTSKILGVAPMTFCSESCLHRYDGNIPVKNYIDSIKPHGFGSWKELFELIDCDYIRDCIDMLYDKYTCLEFSVFRNSLMIEMVETQLMRVKRKFHM